ncbi:class II fructose-bisphosphate aldolase [Alginatibacterium sediminis]|uniref:Class II fructose-bisphosphate aldolase n=1 Tax=Alginatibacterium sediminis TaxID=2164068 RepID=A0A420E7J4_9ALTE|nr:class II fructose-bisphosphate aldolase [Alginatibacterium sediminis]RKF13692.1 class II fructose-bisphosphate aldolase [Alginatibacterium sediminis]
MQSLKQVFESYYAQGKAIPSFNFNDIWDLQAICKGMQEQNEPVLVMTYTVMVKAVGLETCVAMVEAARKQFDIPIYLHLDHCPEIDLCKAAVDLGYDSVMYDGSELDLDSNIKNTKEVVDYAHAKGVLVEAELGRIKGRDFDENADYLAQVSDVKALVAATGVDILAVGIGTAHGFYEGEPQISFQRLDEIRNAVKTPLVLHGGTGIEASDLRKSVAMGVVKINVGTAIHTTYMQELRAAIEADGQGAYPPITMQKVLPQITKEVKKYAQMIAE